MFSVDNSAIRRLIKQGGNFDDNRAECLRLAQHLVHGHGELIRQHHRDGASGSETVQKITLLMDTLVTDLTAYALMDVTTPQPYAIIAVGGYGRCEMNPRSDVDLMFYVKNSSSDFAQQLSQRVLYLLWDLGLDVGHSVRNDTQCHSAAAEDLTVCTALLDARFICGDKQLFTQFDQQVLPAIMRNNSRTFIRDKLVEHQQRRKKYGSSVYILEPNIKEGEGGLRDIHTMLWISMVKYKARSLGAMIVKGVLTEPEREEINSSLDYLWRIRNELHYLSSRKNDQLHFEQQEQIATFLGYKDNEDALAVEQFMRDYYAAAARVEHITSMLIARATDREKAERGFGGYMRRRIIDDGFYALRGELFFVDDNLPAEQPEMMMKAFWLMQRHQLKLAIRTKMLIRENLHRINDAMRRNRQVAKTFLEILGYKKGVYDTLFQMHHLLFLNHYIPEFRRIYCQVQHDAYHIYTVDTHTLFAVQEIDKLWQGEYRDKKELLTRLADEVEKPELLILAVLLHDIGKGEGHNHSEKGAAMVPTIARRLRLGKEDSQRLEFLVRHHLQMAHISQRRDLNDPHLIAWCAQLMESSENLKMLYLLTFADIKAVGPDVWSEWKGFLLQELYEKTYMVMEKGNFRTEQYSAKIRNRKRKVMEILVDDYDKKVIRECLNNFSTRYLMTYKAVQIARHVQLILARNGNPMTMRVEHKPDLCFTEVTISTLDVPGLFCIITGVMAANGVNILGAQIYTQKSGVALDILQVGRDGQIYDDERKWKNIEADLNSCLSGETIVADLVGKRGGPSILDKGAQAPQIPPKVSIDNEVSVEYTVIDITAKDKVGLLYQLADCLKQIGLHIGVAKVTTKADMAGDTFYVQDIFGHKVTQADKLEELRATLLDELSE